MSKNVCATRHFYQTGWLGDGLTIMRVRVQHLVGSLSSDYYFDGWLFADRFTITVL